MFNVFFSWDGHKGWIPVKITNNILIIWKDKKILIGSFLKYKCCPFKNNLKNAMIVAKWDTNKIIENLKMYFS